MSGLVAMLLSSCDQDITNVINLPGGQDTTTPAAQKGFLSWHPWMA